MMRVKMDTHPGKYFLQLVRWNRWVFFFLIQIDFSWQNFIYHRMAFCSQFGVFQFQSFLSLDLECQCCMWWMHFGFLFLPFSSIFQVSRYFSLSLLLLVMFLSFPFLSLPLPPSLTLFACWSPTAFTVTLMLLIKYTGWDVSMCPFSFTCVYVVYFGSFHCTLRSFLFFLLLSLSLTTDRHTACTSLDQLWQKEEEKKEGNREKKSLRMKRRKRVNDENEAESCKYQKLDQYIIGNIARPLFCSLRVLWTIHTYPPTLSLFFSFLLSLVSAF